MTDSMLLDMYCSHVAKAKRTTLLSKALYLIFRVEALALQSQLMLMKLKVKLVDWYHMKQLIRMQLLGVTLHSSS